MAGKEYTDVIWTDNERTRYVIWEAYEAFCEHYETWLMYKERGIDHPIARLGLIRYANRLYIEIKHLITKFTGKEKMSEEQVGKFLHLMNKPKHHFKHEDFNFIRNIVADFMYFSGIKNIVISKDTRSNFDKISKEWGVQ